MKIKFYTILLIIISFSKVNATIYFATTNDTQKITTNTNDNLRLEKTKETIIPNLKLNSTDIFLKVHDNVVVDSKRVVAKDFVPEKTYVSHPFRYTEVTFILSAAFAYAYASLATLAVYNLQNNFIVQLPEKGAYKTLNISTTTFQIFSGIAVAGAVAYDSYQRIYGKKKKDSLSFNFIPFYDAPRKDAGFVFTMNYPLGKNKIIK